MNFRQLFVFSAILPIAITTSSFSAAQQAEDYKAPRTEYGHPDLQGVWNFSSNIPMQRNRRFGEQEFLTAEEVAEERARVEAAAAAAAAAAATLVVDPDAPPEGDNPGGYNDFWFESAGIGDLVRTSHIVYPKDGRVPEAVEGAPRQYGGLGPDIPGSRPVRYVVAALPKTDMKIAGSLNAA